MKRSLLFFISIFLCAFMVTTEVDAQRNKYKRRKNKQKKLSNYRGNKGKKSGVFGRFRPYMWAGGGINAANYFGDLAPASGAVSTDISFTRPGLGGVVGYRFNPYMSARANVNWYRISASDFSADPTDELAGLRYMRNLSFRNDIFEALGGFEIDFLPNHGGSTNRVALTPYVFIGAGFYTHNPKGKVPTYNTFSPDYNVANPTSSPASATFSNAGDWVSLRQLGTVGEPKAYASFGFSVPVAVGVRVRLPANFDAAIEFGYRHIFTDYIDDVGSGEYQDSGLFTDDLARAMADRSLEHVDAISGDPRTLIPPTSYSAQNEIRGNPDSSDKIFVTQIRLTYLLNVVKKRAKFR